jgi:thiamine-monophosphate kinase
VKSEFEFINYIKKSYGLTAIGDDCAVLPKDDKTDMVITADMLVEDIDFRLEWTTAESLGHKALAVSLSDIAAMGALPKWAMLTLAVPEALWETDFLAQFFDGWTSFAAQHNIELVGGDISRSPSKFVIDSIASGEVEKGHAILRSGAKPGDAIFVSGSLGGAAGGLKILERGGRNEKSGSANLVERQLRPNPRIELGRFLVENIIANSMIDLSDGLSSDLHHICEASGVGAVLDLRSIPVDENLAREFGTDESFSLALNGGEDFELLFTVAEKNISMLENQEVTRIGTLTKHSEIVELIDGATRSKLYPSGYRHF